MKGWWWKFSGVLILVYSLSFGLLIPLKPGIEFVNPDSMVGGSSFTLGVRGYNTHFSKDVNGLRAWLKLTGNHGLKATQIEVHNDTYLEATFEVPVSLNEKPPSYFMTLVLDDRTDGFLVLPDAVYLSPSSITLDESAPQLAWQEQPEGLHQATKISFPYRSLLAETIRNTYFHVPQWFGMIIILMVSMIYSIRFLASGSLKFDHPAVSFATIGVLLGILGLSTGAVWARYTWGSFWSWDIKQIVSAVALLIYLAYFVLRRSFEEEEQRARLSAVFNIFAFAALIPLLFVIPRLNSVGVSLHPGNGGNPGFGGDDLDNTMRMVFYPAIIGWTLLGVWMATLLSRYRNVKEKMLDHNY